MIEYLIFNIEYCWKKHCSGKGPALIIFLAALCCGCVAEKDCRADDGSVKSMPAAAAVNSVAEANKVDEILAKLDQKSREIKTYEAKIVYLIKQPDLQSEILRSGKLYYINDEKGSKLRINFTSQRQDSEPVPDYREEFLFDGVNLTRVDYRSKNAEYRQLTDANKPLNAFDLASRYLPIVGFAKADKLKEDFYISLLLPAGREDKDSDQLLLKTRPQSQYKNDYAQIRFWIDKRTSMPVRMEATTPQEDISDVKLEEAKVNKSLPKDIFDIAVPANFGKNVIPLEKEKK